MNGFEEGNDSVDINDSDRVPVNGSENADLLLLEFHKLWTVINFIHRKIESPVDHCQSHVRTRDRGI